MKHRATRQLASSLALRTLCLARRLLWFVSVGVFALVPVRADGAAGRAAELAPADLTKLTPEELGEVQIPSVFGASKFEQPTTKAPSSVTIVTADEIRRFGHRNLAEVLNTVPGLYTTYDRNYTYLGVRGFNQPGDYGTRVLVLVDGHRVNDNVFYGALYGNEFILDADLIERVEIIRGPGSSLYGGSAFFGVVNVVTKRGRLFDGAETTFALGSFESYQGRFTYGKRFANEVELLLSGTFSDTRGQRTLLFPEYRDAASRNHGVARWADGEDYQSFLAKVAYGGLRLEGAYVSRDKGVPTGAFGTIVGDPRNRTTDQRGYLDLSFAHDFSEATHLSARVYYDRYDYTGCYVLAPEPGVIPEPYVQNQDLAVGEWWGTEIQVNQRLWDRLTLTGGLEYRDHLRQDQDNYNVDPPRVALHEPRSSEDVAVFAQAEVNVLTNMTFNVGGRYDYYETCGGSANPRCALIWSPVANSTLKCIYGTAFRAPNVFELYYQDAADAVSNPALRPETVETYEVVWEQGLGRHLRASAAGYYYQINDLITAGTDPVSGLAQYQNSGHIEAAGMELSMEARWSAGATVRVSYSLQETEDRDSGLRLDNSPEHLGKLNLSVPVVRDRVFASLEVQAVSGRRTLDDYARPYAVFNLTLFTQRLWKSLEASATIYNLLDTRYGDPAGPDLDPVRIILRDGRSFRLHLTYRF